MINPPAWKTIAYSSVAGFTIVFALGHLFLWATAR